MVEAKETTSAIPGSTSATIPDAEASSGSERPGLLKQILAFLISVGLHVGLLAILYVIKINITEEKPPKLNVETAFVEEDLLQDQDILDVSDTTEVSTTLNPFQSGGVVTTALGSAGAPSVSQQRIEDAMELEESDFEIPPAEMALPSNEKLGENLGQGEVRGETGAIVEGYGAALSQISKELARMMREDPVLVVWLFDESESMKDDQQRIRDEFMKVYEELRLVREKDEDLKNASDIIQTMVMSYGAQYRKLTPRPTSDVEAIRKAIDRIPIDASGAENMNLAIHDTIRALGPVAMRDKPRRKLVLIVVSDESGDDGEGVEQALMQAQKFKAPIFFMGREAIFGYPTARYRYTDERGLRHWLPMRRGPETAFREALQWNGLHERWDSDRSGFSPYEQARLARETGGIFFLLPNEEENLVGRSQLDRKKLEFIDLKKYQPLLLGREEYARTILSDDFRKRIAQVIDVLDPKQDKQLRIRSELYSIEKAEFEQQARTNFIKAGRAMEALSQAIAILEKIEPLRDEEKYDRWRANYDLIYAQCLCYRVRLFQYMLAMDQHVRDFPKPKNPKTNRWDVRRYPEMKEPDEEQFQRIAALYKITETRDEFLARMERQRARAAEMYQEVIDRHPNTPWGRRAAEELRQGFGMTFRERFWDPRYREPVKLPKL